PAGVDPAAHRVCAHAEELGGLGHAVVGHGRYSGASAAEMHENTRICVHSLVMPGVGGRSEPVRWDTGRDMSSEPTGRPGRYQRSAAGLVASLVVTVAVIGAVLYFMGAFRNDYETRPEA